MRSSEYFRANSSSLRASRILRTSAHATCDRPQLGHSSPWSHADFRLDVSESQPGHHSRLPIVVLLVGVRALLHGEGVGGVWIAVTGPGALLPASVVGPGAVRRRGG